MRRAFITGITGQDGSYLAELLLEKGYEIHGTTRPRSVHRARFEALPGMGKRLGQSVWLHEDGEGEGSALRKLLEAAAPDEVYHLAGHSDVTQSLVEPLKTSEGTGLGTLRLLDILRLMPRRPRAFFASSAHVFGCPAASPQNEETPFRPVTPYGCAKVFSTQMAGVYREAYGLFACTGIMFNHESPRRAEGFVGRKICRAAAAIRLGLQRELLLGDRSVVRDWGHARDYARAMWLMLQHPAPGDYVLATGHLHSVQEIVESAFAAAGLDWRSFVRDDPALRRAGDAPRLAGDASKARRVLGWQPEVGFAELITEMVEAELADLQSDRKSVV